MVHPGMESIPEHPHFSDAMTDQMQPTPLEKPMPTPSPLTNPMSHQSIHDHLSQSNAIGNLPCIDNNLHPLSENGLMQPHLDSHMLQPLQQQQQQQLQPQPSLQPPSACLAEDYSQTQPLDDASVMGATTVSDMLPNEHNNLPLVNDHIPEQSAQNCAPETELNQTVNQQQPSGSESVFDALSNDFRLKNIQENNNQLQTQENEVQQEVPNTNAAAEKNDFPHSDDDDDYGAPGSVGPTVPEEQQADETYEQFEERILTKRTVHMLHIINNRLIRDEKVNFGDFVRNHKRKQVAQKFYTFLVLKKQQAVELEQNSSYGDLIITKGPKFNAVYNGN